MNPWDLAAELAKLGIGLARAIGSAPSGTTQEAIDEVRRGHEREVSDAIMRYQLANSLTAPSEPPRE